MKELIEVSHDAILRFTLFITDIKLSKSVFVAKSRGPVGGGGGGPWAFNSPILASILLSRSVFSIFFAVPVTFFNIASSKLNKVDGGVGGVDFFDVCKNVSE